MNASGKPAYELYCETVSGRRLRLWNGRGSPLQAEQSPAQGEWLTMKLLMTLFKEETVECNSFQQTGNRRYQAI